MKKIFTWVFVMVSAISLISCDTLTELSKTAMGGSSSTALTNADVVNGLKQALQQGTTKGVSTLSAKDGFFKNPSVKVLFPPEAQKVEKTLRDIGAGQVVDVAIEKINRAAEDAAVGAKDIFIKAITSMTINDAMNILMGADDACTQYLKRTTSSQLYSSFNPVIANSLNKVGASDAWTTAISNYNKVPFVQKVNPDLDDHVTNKAMDGLFLMIQKEEALIRKDPVKRVTDILKRVFAKQDGR
jgi:hypothetical protein